LGNFPILFIIVFEITNKNKRYCQNLECDGVPLYPLFEIETYGGNFGFTATLILPPNASIHDKVIVNIFFNTEKLFIWL
jgi:hypothetical protein